MKGIMARPALEPDGFGPIDPNPQSDSILLNLKHDLATRRVRLIPSHFTRFGALDRWNG